MATTRKSTAAKTTAAKTERPAPKDHLPKKDAAEKEALEALTGDFILEIDGEEFEVNDPMDWAADAAMALQTGQWIVWARTALVDSEKNLGRFMGALGEITNRELNETRWDTMQRHAVAMGEGLSSPRS